MSKISISNNSAEEDPLSDTEATNGTESVNHSRWAENALRESEQKFSAIFQTIPDVVAILRLRDGLVLDVNDKWTQMTGYEKSERIGKTFDEINLYVDPLLRARQVEEIIQKGEVHDLEALFRRKDGSILRGLMSARVIELDGELCAVMITRDITDLRAAEEARRQSEEKFLTIFQTIPDAVSIIRLKDWVAIDVNEAWTRQTGYLKSERIGRPIQDLELFVDPEARESQLQVLLEKGEAYNLEAQYRIKDGTVRYGLTSARVIELDGEQCAVGITRDITDLKRAEEAVRESEAKFRTLAETTPSAIIVYGDHDRIRYVNPGAESMSGYSRSDLLQMSIVDLIHPDFTTLVNAVLVEQRPERGSLRAELRLLRRGGEERWVDWSAGAIDFEGRPAIIVTAFDITERKRAEEALRQSEERYRLIVENQTEFIVKWLPDGTRTFVNESYCRYFGVSEDECVGTSFMPLVFPEFRDYVRRLTGALTPDAPEYTDEHLSFVPGGQRWQQWTNRGIFDASGNLVELLSSGRDITDRKLAEEREKESRRQLRALSAHLQSVREEERTRIAREIHDELGQALTGLKMDLSFVQSGVGKAADPGLARLVERTTSMSRLIDSTIQTVRRIATQLRPGILDDLGLVAALEWQAQDFQSRTGIVCRFKSDLEHLDLDRDRSTAAFRIFQETLTNIARHSGANAVDVNLRHSDGEVVLHVMDNGKGILEADISGGGSLGILGMRERAHELGGELKIDGDQGKGTTVTLRIPLA